MKKLKLIIACVPLFISAIINVYFAFVLQNVIDVTSSKDTNLLIKSIVFAVIYLFFDVIVSLIAKYTTSKYIKSELIAAKNNNFNGLIRSSSCQASNSISIDSELIERDYYQQIVRVVYNSFQFVVGLIAIIYISFTLTVAIALVTLIPILIPSLFKTVVRNSKNDFVEQTSNYNSFVEEAISGHDVICDFGLYERFRNQHNTINIKVEKARMKSRFIEQSVDIISENLGMLTFITALGLGSYYVIVGKMTYGLMIASIQLMNNLIQPLNIISNSMNKINSVKDVMNKFGEHNITDEEMSKLGSNIETIELIDIHFSYGGKKIFNGLNLKFEQGKSYSIIGESGVGKTTILKLISGEIVPDKGQIKVNGIQLSDLNMNDYRQKLGYARQGTYLFNDSIYNNIVLWSKNEKSCFNNVINQALVNRFVEGDEHGLDKVISNAEGISGGQKQRVGLARILYHEPDVLLLDEVTSSLDSENAKAITNNLLNIRDKIKIFITHNYSQDELKKFDEIISLS